ncbi:MAG: hypothetical protein PHV34_17625 [Verrucomicrobiae bacterium]|nr:hypothetical protein [Verrucomicrobiae bacterium]
MASEVPFRPWAVKNRPVSGGMITAHASAESFGGGQAEDLAGASQALGTAGYRLNSVAMEEQDRLNKNTVRDAGFDAQAQTRDFLAKDIFARQGLQAATAESDTRKKLAEIKSTVSQKLANTAQKEIFESQWRSLENDSIARVQSFQLQESKRAEKATRAAQNANEVADAVTYYNDPERLKKAEFRISQNVIADNAGMGPEVQGAAVREHVHHLYSAIADRIGQSSPFEALKFINQYENKFDSKWVMSTKAGLERQASNVAAAGLGNSLASNPAMDAVMARESVLSQIKDPASQEHAMQVFKTARAEQSAVARDKERAFVEGQWQAAIKDPEATINPALPADEQIKIQRFREARANGETEATQKAVYGMLIGKMATGEIRGMNLYEFAPYLTQHDLGFLLSHQGRMRRGDGTKAEDAAFQKAVKGAAADVQKLPMFKISEKDDEETILKKQFLADQFTAAYAQKLSALPPEKWQDFNEVDKLKRNLLRDGVTLEKGTWMPFDGKPFFDVKGMEFQNYKKAVNVSKAADRKSVAEQAVAGKSQSDIQGKQGSDVSGWLDARTGIPQSVAPLTFGDLAYGVKEAWEAHKMTGRAIGNAIMDYGVKPIVKVQEAVGAAIGDELAKVASDEDFTRAMLTHERLARSGVDTSELDDFWRQRRARGNPIGSASIYVRKVNAFVEKTFKKEK